MDFILNGNTYCLTHGDVETVMRGVPPEQIFEHAVEVNRELFPPKQVFAIATGRPASEFTTHRAQDVLRRLGFTDPRKIGQVRQKTSSVNLSGQEPVWVLELRTPAGGYQEFELAESQDLDELERLLAYSVGTTTSSQVRAMHPDAVGGEAVFTIPWQNVSAATLFQRLGASSRP